VRNARFAEKCRKSEVPWIYVKFFLSVKKTKLFFVYSEFNRETGFEFTFFKKNRKTGNRKIFGADRPRVGVI
jgi:hypothetical protein